MSADKTHTKKIIESCCCWWIRIVGPFLRFLLSIFGPQNGQARAGDASIIFHTVMQGKKWAIVDDVALKPSFILCNNNNVRCCGMCNKSIGADFGREYDVDPDECARRCRIVGYRISCPPFLRPLKSIRRPGNFQCFPAFGLIEFLLVSRGTIAFGESTIA